jgi:hypothetical protein
MGPPPPPEDFESIIGADRSFVTAFFSLAPFVMSLKRASYVNMSAPCVILLPEPLAAPEQTASSNEGTYPAFGDCLWRGGG